MVIDLPRALARLYPKADPLVDYRLQDDGEGPYLAHWSSALGPRPTEAELAAAAIDDAKDRKNTEINDARLAANSSAFPFGGRLIACDRLSRSDIDGVATFVAFNGVLPPGFPGAWKATDNSYVPIQDVASFKAMHAAMVAQGAANFMHSEQLKGALAQAQTPEDIAAITWEA